MGEYFLIMAVVYKNKPLVEFLISRVLTPIIKIRFFSFGFCQRLKRDDLVRILNKEEGSGGECGKGKKPVSKAKARWKKPILIKSKINTGALKKENLTLS